MQWRGLGTMAQEELDYRYKYLEEKVDGHEDRIRGLEKVTNEITKISTILEMQTEMNKKQDETLSKINENLTNLNHKSDRLTERVDGLEHEVKEHTTDNNVNISKLQKKIGWTIFTLVLGGFITWGFAKLKGE